MVEGIAQFSPLWVATHTTKRSPSSSPSLADIGGGAFFPMFAALTPDYFGENNNASNNGIVDSSRPVSGLCGLGVASGAPAPMSRIGQAPEAAALAATVLGWRKSALVGGHTIMPPQSEGLHAGLATPVLPRCGRCVEAGCA
jgi:hypothetical protein